MNGKTQDPLTLKLRSTLFELRSKGLCGIKRNYVQGPLLGVTIMTKRYKSKRQFEVQQSAKTNRERDQNEFKTEIFKRLASKNHKRSSGLEIAKAVFHCNEPKKNRVSTQRSIGSAEEHRMSLLGKDTMYSGFGRNRKVLATHRENGSDFRLSFAREADKSEHFWYPGTNLTQTIARKYKNRDKMRSMQVQAQRLDSIEGWNVENQEENDYL